MLFNSNFQLSLIYLQKHIVKFVNYIDDDEKIVLIIKYLLKNNLKMLNQKKKLFIKKTKIVFHQTLQVFAYFHDEKNIIHYNIKSMNIFIWFKISKLFIKLCDFDLSTEKNDFKTFCKMKLYVATKIFNKFYTNTVNIWMMKVINCEFIISLLKKTKDSTF